MTVERTDDIGIVVEDVDAVIAFFVELGLTLQGRAMVEGAWAGRVTGLGAQRVEIAMLRTPDGHGGLELSRFLEPPVVADHRTASVNALGRLRAMFTVKDLDDTLERLRARRDARRRSGAVRGRAAALPRPRRRGAARRARGEARVMRSADRRRRARLSPGVPS